MSSKKKWIKGDLDVTCMLCLEKQNRVFELHKKFADTIKEVLDINVDNIIKLPKRVCYRCYFIVEYMRDYRKLTIRNITVAENKLPEDNSTIIYDKPLIFNIITDKVLKEENIPYNLEMTEYNTSELKEKDNDNLLIPQSYRDVTSDDQDILPFEQTIFQCKYCTMAYNKKTSLVHHERKHLRQIQRDRCRSALSNRSRSYTCDDCDNETVFTSVTELRKHKKLHAIAIICRMGCGENFNASFEREFHESVCNERFSTEDLEQPGVRTRSRSRLGSLSRSSSVESFGSSNKSGWSSEDNWDSVSTRITETNKNKRKSRYDSCDTCSSNNSTVTIDSKRQSSLTKSTCSTTNTRNELESPVLVKSRGRPKKRNQSDIESEKIISNQETSRRILEPIGFQPKTIVESIYYLKNHHRQPIESTKKYCCRKCRFSDYNVDILSRHETLKHNIQPWYLCNECRKAFTNKKFLDHHKNVEHRGGPFVCAICSEVHLSQRNLQLHLFNHRQSKNEECGACDKKFLTVDQLKIHIDCETDERHCIFKSGALNMVEYNSNNYSHSVQEFLITEVISLQSGSRPSTPFPTTDDDQTSIGCNDIENNIIQDNNIEVHEQVYEQVQDISV